MELGQVEILYYVRFNCSYKYFRHCVEYLRKKQERTTQIHARICSEKIRPSWNCMDSPAKFLIHLMLQEYLWQNNARVRQLLKFKIAFVSANFTWQWTLTFWLFHDICGSKLCYDWVLYHSLLCFDYKVCGTQSPIRLWFYRAAKYFYNSLGFCV